MKFPVVSLRMYDTLRKKLLESDDSGNGSNCFRGIYRRHAKIMIQEQQFTQFLNSSQGRVLKLLRKAWYHDSLIHEIVNPGMRLIRKLRLGASELRDHCFYMNGGTRICPMCNQDTETLNHFFFVCPKYISQRERFLSKFYIWTNEIGVNLNIRTILGFHEKLANKKFARLTRTVRENIFQETIDYILSANRFKYL